MSPGGADAGVPLIDLGAQYAAIASDLEAAVLDVLRSQRYVLGERVTAFERRTAEYLRVRHAIGVASGSDALLLALLALDLRPGDEVVTSPFSFFATAAAIVRAGATPVFADIDPRSFNLDPAAAARAVTRRTRALLPVHLFGRCVDFAAFDALAREHRLPIVEDAAQAIGAERNGVRAGAWGDLACFSFYPTKNLGGAGDGGLVSTGDEGLAERVRRLRVHGESSAYRHEELGINSRLDALQAAVLSVKLRSVDAWNQARRARAARYAELFSAAGLDEVLALPATLEAAADPGHVFHLYVVRAPHRDELKAHLDARGIGAGVYYPIPLHLQPCFAGLGYRRGDLQEAERAAEEVLALPVYPELTVGQQERVVATVRSFYRP